VVVVVVVVVVVTMLTGSGVAFGVGPLEAEWQLVPWVSAAGRRSIIF
jgi:hypothetical protein